MRGCPPARARGCTARALLAHEPAPRPLKSWWPESTERVVRLTVMATCDRLRLMFFGNLRQDWSEFVLSELGHQRFEAVAFDDDSRAFRRREEVDAYLVLHRLRQRLDEGEAVAPLAEALPPAPANRWLASRRARLCIALGRQAEREGQVSRALSLYARAGWPVGTGSAEGRIRLLRLAERLGEIRKALALAEPLPAATHDEAEVRRLAGCCRGCAGAWSCLPAHSPPNRPPNASPCACPVLPGSRRQCGTICTASRHRSTMSRMP